MFIFTIIKRKSKLYTALIFSGFPSPKFDHKCFAKITILDLLQSLFFIVKMDSTLLNIPSAN
jgi:hypothetical protein